MTPTHPANLASLALRIGQGENFESAVKATTGITVKPRPGGNLFVNYEMQQDDMPYPVTTVWRVEEPAKRPPDPLNPGDDPTFILVEWATYWEVLEGEEPPSTNPTTEEVYEAVLEAAQEKYKEYGI